jgi:hypothetical protein
MPEVLLRACDATLPRWLAAEQRFEAVKGPVHPLSWPATDSSERPDSTTPGIVPSSPGLTVVDAVRFAGAVTGEATVPAEADGVNDRVSALFDVEVALRARAEGPPAAAAEGHQRVA